MRKEAPTTKLRMTQLRDYWQRRAMSQAGIAHAAPSQPRGGDAECSDRYTRRHACARNVT